MVPLSARSRATPLLWSAQPQQKTLGQLYSPLLWQPCKPILAPWWLLTALGEPRNALRMRTK
eukprot:12378186-Alexandrium_andersonii.AAC.1